MLVFTPRPTPSAATTCVNGQQIAKTMCVWQFIALSRGFHRESLHDTRSWQRKALQAGLVRGKIFSARDTAEKTKRQPALLGPTQPWILICAPSARMFAAECAESLS